MRFPKLFVKKISFPRYPPHPPVHPSKNEAFLYGGRTEGKWLGNFFQFTGGLRGYDDPYSGLLDNQVPLGWIAGGLLGVACCCFFGKVEGVFALEDFLQNRP